MNSIQIGPHRIGPDEPVMVIAEIGINHNGDVDLGKELIDEAAAAGAKGIKFQTYRTETRFDPGNPFIEVFKKMELGAEEEKELWDHALSHPEGLSVLSSPFDAEMARFCVELGAHALKLASFETTNKQLVRGLAEQRIPVMVSTGQTRTEEADEVVRILDSAGAPCILLHCVSSYPMAPEDANLSVIHTLRQRYDHLIGFSDHSLGHDVTGLAVAAGARVVEKHFTLDNSLEGPDHAFSTTPEALRALVQHVEHVDKVMGDPRLRVRDSEQFIYENSRRVTD